MPQLVTKYLPLRTASAADVALPETPQGAGVVKIVTRADTVVFAVKASGAVTASVYWYDGEGDWYEDTAAALEETAAGNFLVNAPIRGEYCFLNFSAVAVGQTAAVKYALVREKH